MKHSNIIDCRSKANRKQTESIAAAKRIESKPNESIAATKRIEHTNKSISATQRIEHAINIDETHTNEHTTHSTNIHEHRMTSLCRQTEH